jgi:hypothetical protein
MKALAGVNGLCAKPLSPRGGAEAYLAREIRHRDLIARKRPRAGAAF